MKYRVLYLNAEGLTLQAEVEADNFQYMGSYMPAGGTANSVIVVLTKKVSSESDEWGNHFPEYSNVGLYTNVVGVETIE